MITVLIIGMITVSGFNGLVRLYRAGLIGGRLLFKIQIQKMVKPLCQSIHIDAAAPAVACAGSGIGRRGPPVAAVIAESIAAGGVR